MAATNDDNVYIKRNKRYIPFGRKINENYLPDGIWFVRHSEYSIGTTNVDHYLRDVFKVGEKPNFIDIPKLCAMQEYVDYVITSPAFKKIIEEGKYSFYDLTAKIVALVVNLNDTINKKRNDDNKRFTGNSNSLPR